MSSIGGQEVNIGLAIEVVKWADELVLSWKSVNDCRDHLNKVKAQSYIDKYEMKLCESTIACETALTSINALIEVAQDDRVQREGGVLTVVTLLDLISQASNVAKSDGWQCTDLLEAVSRDVVNFAKEMGIESRVAPTSWAPASSKRGQRNISTKTYKKTTKPDVRTARSSFSSNNADPRRKRIQPDHRVDYREEKKIDGRRLGRTSLEQRLGDGLGLGLGRERRKVFKKGKGTMMRKGTFSSRNDNRGGDSAPPDLSVATARYDMSMNPFAVTGSKGRGRR
jgi:hypothetical protein